MVLVYRILFLIGGGILLINFFGLLIGLRNNDIYFEKTYLNNKIELPLREVYNKLNNIDDCRDKNIIELTDIVNKGIAHYWFDDISKYNMTIPYYENFILYLMSYLDPHTYKKYEFVNYNKALERGIGLCSQYSSILVQIFQENNCDARIVGLGRHVVSTVQLKDGNWWIVDANYNIVIPFSLTYIEKNPNIVKNFYLEKGYSEEISNSMVEIYSKEKNIIYPKDGGKWYSKKADFEKVSYILKWIIPIILILPLIIFFLFKRNK